MVGKYVDLAESYKSLSEALTHGGLANECAVEIEYIDAEEIVGRGAGALLDGVDGVLVPGGFGERGSEGKVAAIQYAREEGIPFFGICLGMQMAVVEYARHVAGIEGAQSTEFAPKAEHQVIHLMHEQQDVTEKGGTMRLGAYDCELVADSLAGRLYGKPTVSERHRHRYEFNNGYREKLQQAGLVLCGLSPDGNLVEMVELPKDTHPFFLGCQFHPEFKSRPTAPHPLFVGFIAARARATPAHPLRRRGPGRAPIERRSSASGDADARARVAAAQDHLSFSGSVKSLTGRFSAGFSVGVGLARVIA